MVKEFQQKQLLIVEKLTRLALNTLVYFIMAKFLDEKDFGIYNHIISIVLLINALSTLGFESYLVESYL
ncbi:oligosaccharide flippase family protein, partial [Vibrio alginolyticus]|uniref:oligosaccharide flippase family protein n=1 Tax=Vibrio alginolyticus TaxID=663 RepID=UPI0006CAA879